MSTAQPASAASSDLHAHDDRTFVVVGAGLAGARAVDALRAKGFGGRLVLIGDEAERPYERPPLSKGYLNGVDERDSVFVHPAEWYDDHQVDLRLWTTVTAIDRTSRHVEIATGEPIRYDKLLLATGSRPRLWPGLAENMAGVHYLRRIGQSDVLKATIAASRSLVVIGAGWIGLEIAAAARTAGVAVTVVESADLPLLRVLGPEVAQVFADLHREHEVDLRLGVQIAEIVVTDERATGVRLSDGVLISADAIVIGIGAIPNTELAGTAGLDVDNGVLVDAGLTSSDPDVYAAGDIANAEHPLLGRRIRVEHWANADRQPAIAAGSMLGESAGYDELPYFYTDQYDLGMEYLGYVEPGSYDRVVFRGDVPGREFIAFWTLGGRVLAGMNVNVWDVQDDIKRLVTAGYQGRDVDLSKLADPSVPLADL